MPKRIILYIVFLCVLAGAYSCQTSRQLPYFKDLPDTTAVSHIATRPYEPLRLQPNDELQITVSSPSPEASRFFNLTAALPAQSANMASVESSSREFVNVYHVSFDGLITMPVLGDIRAAGMTTEELRLHILEKLKDYLKDAVVTVSLTNFKVTVIGEVNRPVVVPVNGQTINVLEAIGASGDMTVFGIRKNVRIIRRLPNGGTEVAILDFNKSDVMRSPYFQLKQNDIVYIQPNKNKGIQATKSGIWIPIVTTLISVTAIIIASR